MHRRERRVRLFWLWALPPLLLTAALVIPALGDIAFNGDETSSLLDGAGVSPSGPQSLAEIPNFLAPNQALGWPVLLFLWVRLAGWSEIAARALPLFAGLLTIAMAARTGRDLFGARAGLLAALLLSVSMFLQTYMLHARVFTLVAFCATLCLQAWWRVALHPRPPGRGAQMALLLGATGLLYMHYYAALLLPVLGLFHLLFVPRPTCCPPKMRRWWRPVLLLGLAGLAATPQLPLLLQGLALNAADDFLHTQALTAPELLARFVRNLVNGALAPTPAVGSLLLLLLPLTLALATLRQWRTRRRADATWLLVFVCLALLLLFTLANEMLRLITRSRLRYLLALWPLLAVAAGAGLHRLAGSRPRPVALLLALWLGAGVWLGLTTNIRYDLGHFHQSVFHHVYRLMREHIRADDLLMMDTFAEQHDPGQMYSWVLGASRVTLYRYREDPYGEARPLHGEHAYAWLLYLSKDRVGFADLPAELGRVLCERALDERGFTLERYALHSVENCPEVPARLEFDGGIRLIAPVVSIADGRLRLDAHFHSDDDAQLANYSLAVHVIDPRTGERVAQGDTGVGPGNIVPLRSEIDISALPAGEYELRVGLYNWQTGELLPGRDVESGASGDMHTLQHFRVG